MLELRNVSKKFSGKPILHDISLLIPKGQTHALIGASGSGKTTLLRILLGLLALDGGEVQINQRQISSFQPSQWSEKIGYVPQDSGLFPHLDAEHNITLVARMRHWKSEKIRYRIDTLKEMMALESSMLRRYPSELSGGQRQRVAMMRAAFLDPEIMLLDEPMGALDPLLRRSLQNELKRIFGQLKKTVLIVTHDLSEAVYLAECMTLLHQGKIIQTGTYEDFVRHPKEDFVEFFINANRGLPDVGASL